MAFRDQAVALQTKVEALAEELRRVEESREEERRHRREVERRLLSLRTFGHEDDDPFARAGLDTACSLLQWSVPLLLLVTVAMAFFRFGPPNLSPEGVQNFLRYLTAPTDGESVWASLVVLTVVVWASTPWVIVWIRSRTILGLFGGLLLSTLMAPIPLTWPVPMLLWKHRRAFGGRPVCRRGRGLTR